TKSDEYDRLQAGGLSVSQDDLREAVRRDIEMLFNVERLEAEYDLSELEQGQFAAQYGDLTDEPDGDMPRRRVEMHADILDDFPHVRTSVINYGVPPFTGSQGSSIDRHALGRQLRDVLQVYEPRLRPNSIRVSVQPNGRGGLGVKIEAVLMMQPSPEKMWLNTEVDVEKGRATTSFEATQKV
ncbi:MAG: type VI secretion system baseplate subunit TssE, partial [Pseudomonadota bacterium]